MNAWVLIKIGGISGIVLGVVQLAGIIMHGSIPADPANGLAFVRDHWAWSLTHILLIASYLVVVSFYVGLRATFSRPQPMLEISANLALIGALLGAVHFLIHLSLYPFLATSHETAKGSPLATQIVVFYMSVHQYAHLLNRISLILLMLVAAMFSLALLHEPRYKRWIGAFGLASSVLTLLTVAVVELFLARATGDIVFAIALLPTIVWIVATGIAMLKIQLSAA
jgi:hypothetical protein